MNIAYIFPGQGAQYVGMGQDLYQRYPQAKEVFERADEVLGFDLSELIFKGPLEELTKTDNCQVAIFTVSIACLRALEAECPAIVAKYAAGLSLGEYTALTAADALDFAEGVKLVRKRGQYMEQACQENPGGMAAIIGLPLETVEKICSQAKTEVANLNSPGQVVISGTLAGLEQAKQLAVTYGAKKVISLQVGGAFHCSLMNKAAQKLNPLLAEIQWRSPKIPVVSNVTAAQEDSPWQIKENLTRQLVNRTLWTDSVRFMAACGIRNFLEIGPGKILTGLLRKIDPQLQVDNMGSVDDFKRFK